MIAAEAAPPRPRGWEVALFAVALAAGGLVALTLSFAGEVTYADLTSGRSATFRPVGVPAGGPQAGGTRLTGDGLLDLHRGWVAYVTGRSAAQPAEPFFTPSERAHMADVRGVFVAAQVAAAAAGTVLLWLGWRARRRGTLARLLRAASMAVLVAVGLIGVLAGVAFDAAFLLFHQLFFPQGNFLFEPGSGLLELYPEDYFYGVTLRIGATFVALALSVAALAHLSLRSRGASA